jgi:hypothetical protein
MQAAQAEQDILSEPLNQLQNLAQLGHILNLARAQDGQLGIEQLIERDAHWVSSPSERRVLLNDEMQQYFKNLLKQSSSPFIEILLLGSQGETLAAYPLPDDFWHGNTAKFINVMADQDTFVDELSWDAGSRHIQAQISVPIKDQHDEMFGVLSAKVNTHIQP